MAAFVGRQKQKKRKREEQIKTKKFEVPHFKTLQNKLNTKQYQLKI